MATAIERTSVVDEHILDVFASLSNGVATTWTIESKLKQYKGTTWNKEVMWVNGSVKCVRLGSSGGSLGR